MLGVRIARLKLRAFGYLNILLNGTTALASVSVLFVSSVLVSVLLVSVLVSVLLSVVSVLLSVVSVLVFTSKGCCS